MRTIIYLSAAVIGVGLWSVPVLAQSKDKKAGNPGLPVCQSTGWNQVGYKCYRQSDGKVCTMLGAFAGKGQWSCQ